MVNQSPEIDMLLTGEYAENDDDVEGDEIYVLAGSEDLTPRQLSVLAYCGSSRIRGRVAENPSSPSWLLYHLCQDEDAGVREKLAENPFVPLEILKVLAKDACCDVRYSLAENHQMPLEILQTLLEDQNPHVASRAIKTLTRKMRSSRFQERGLVLNHYHMFAPRQLRVIESAS